MVMLKPSSDVAFREMDGEAVLLDLSTGTYFGLNAVGTRVWQLLADGHDRPRIVETLAAEFDASGETIAADVERLLADLHARGLIVDDGP
jgi:hypothetical protein